MNHAVNEIQVADMLRIACYVRMSAVGKPDCHTCFRKLPRRSYITFILNKPNINILFYFFPIFPGEFNELLRYGEERIKQYFGTMYPNIAGSLEDDIQLLFETLRDHLRGRPTNIPLAVEIFFNELFALLYQDKISPSRESGRQDGLNTRCIAGQQRTIRPFGDFPQEIGIRLYKSVELARLLLTSLNLGVEVLNSTHHMRLGKKCSKGLLEMRYCATCQGLTTVKPCQSYCVNVMKGCLANFVDIDARWNEYVTSVINLVRWSMAVDYDLQLAIHSLDAKVIEAIGVARDDATRIVTEASIDLLAMSLDRETIRNEEQGSYLFTM